MTRLILGSQSPRRKEILNYFSLPFEQITSAFNEESIPYTGNPCDYVCKLSQGKAEVLHHQHPKTIILTADTVVHQDGVIYGKPKNEEEAFYTLTKLAGNWHSVFTGITLKLENRELHRIEETRVLFNPLTPDQIRRYHAKLHWTDKAGGYAIQMGGGLLVKKIEGCYYNVMGLPINSVRDALMEIGIDLWDYLK